MLNNYLYSLIVIKNSLFGLFSAQVKR